MATLWNELSQDEGKKSGYAELVGNVPQLTQNSLVLIQDPLKIVEKIVKLKHMI